MSMREKMKKCIRRILFIGYYLFSLAAIPIAYNHSYRKGVLSYLSKNDFSIWKNSMLKMLKEYCKAGYNFRIHQLVYTFANANIDVVKKSDSEIRKSPIVVLCVKNDLERIQMLVEHYRKYGIKKFAFLDNDSSDGTFEWLMKQGDVDLFRCKQHYQTAVKEGWINRIVSYYGFDRWYILTDSDELVVYIGMEKHPFQDVIKFAEKNNITRFKGLTLDMYSHVKDRNISAGIRDKYCWMDYNTYFESEVTVGKQKYKALLGGPRNRLMKSRITLSKFPLVYFEKGTISDSAHFQFPHEKLSEFICYLGIQHYKFLENDLEIYRKRAKGNEGFSSGGLMYRQYMDYVDKVGCVDFLYEDSIRYNGSDSLRRVEFISDMELDLLGN